MKTAAILAALLTSVVAWNVHDDLLAHPQYVVDLHDDLLANSSAEATLREDTSVSTVSSTPIFMRSASGQAYLCHLPQQKEKSEQEKAINAELSEVAMRKKESDIIFRGLKLLEGMRGHCLYYHQGWWTYKFCYGMEIKQFHAMGPVNGIIPWPPMEDPNAYQFVLGKFSPDLLQIDEGQGTLVHTSAERSYLTQVWTDGTRCDKTGDPRRIDIEYHCAIHMPDVISSIKEVSTCNYKMIVQTPKMCSDAAFVPPQVSNVEDIDCHAVVSDEYYEKKQVEKKRNDEEVLAAMQEHGIEAGDGMNTLENKATAEDAVPAAAEAVTEHDQTKVDEKALPDSAEPPSPEPEHTAGDKPEKSVSDAAKHRSNADLSDEDLDELTLRVKNMIKSLEAAKDKKEKADNIPVVQMSVQIGEDGQLYITQEGNGNANEGELEARIDALMGANDNAKGKLQGQGAGASAQQPDEGYPLSNPAKGFARKVRQSDEKSSRPASNRVYAVHQQKLGNRLGRKLESTEDDESRKRDEL